MKSKIIFGIIMLVIIVSFISGCKINYMDNDEEIEVKRGSNFMTAIPIQAESTSEGIDKEYQYLYENSCKDKGGFAQLEAQELQMQGDHRYDVMHIICANGEKETYYFNIDSFFGKW